MKKINLTLSALVMSLMMISMVSAFGVSSPYWEGNALELARGETKVVNLNLQNMVGNQDVTVQAKLLEGDEIANLNSDEFILVEAQTADTFIPVKIHLPKDITPGTTQEVKVEFKTITNGQGGIALGTGMTIVFDVIATEEVKENNILMILSIILAIIILAIIIKVILKKRKK